ncbi:MAG: amidohydrolase family protein [Synechococcaceae cyanobacterium]|nr:amidohydrolase family protein [Synechococcaceae cyanobacterium]
MTPTLHRRQRLPQRQAVLGATAIAGLLAVLPLPARAMETLYVNGSILTMAGERPTYVEALGVENGRIVFAGARQQALSRKTPSTRIIDLRGKALLPGFLDGHSHYINSLLVANQCKLYAPPAGPGKDVPSILAALKSCAAGRKLRKGEMLMGYGYDDTVMPGGRLLNRDDLDQAFPDNPVRIDHVSMHGGVLNSLALKKYGISAATPTPPGGVIVRKPGTQEPWGLIMETAFLPVFEQSEPITAQQELDWTRAGQMLYAAAGVTTAHEGATHLPQIQTIQRASDAGANLIDVVAYPFITDLDKVLALIPVNQWGRYSNRFKIGGVKITLDGSPQGRTAFFTTPYRTGGPGGEKDWRGEPTFPQDLVNQAVSRVYGMGVPLLVHTNGDAAIDMFLKAYESARRGDFSRPWNVTTIHTQFLRRDQIPSFVKYGIRPSFYTLHTYYFADAHIANRGRKQADYISPMRDAIDAGLHPTNHTDFVVAPLDQLFMLWSAVNRVSRSGESVGPDQRITPYEGLKAMTAWAAEQYGEEASKGTLEVGKLADLVILDKDPLQVAPMAIRDIQVVETIKEGVTIYPQPPGGPRPIAAAPSAKTYTWRAHACDMDDVNEAAGREWILVSLLGEPVSTPRPPTLRAAGGRLSIFGGINRLNGSVALVRDRVVIGELASTKMAGPPELMALENRFAGTLRTVNGFHVKGTKLELLRDETVVATFRAGN